MAADINQHGLECPIELYRGKILDGRRRYRACLLASVEPDFVETMPADPVAYVMSLNLHRRHLTPSQKAMVAARAKGMYEREAKERQREAGKAHGRGKVPKKSSGANGDARDAAGKAVGVSGYSVDAATKVLKKGTPELQEAVDKGTIKVSAAARLAESPKRVQRSALKSGPMAIRNAIEQHSPTPWGPTTTQDLAPIPPVPPWKRLLIPFAPMAKNRAVHESDRNRRLEEGCLTRQFLLFTGNSQGGAA